MDLHYDMIFSMAVCMFCIWIGSIGIVSLIFENKIDTMTDSMKKKIRLGLFAFGIVAGYILNCVTVMRFWELPIVK